MGRLGSPTGFRFQRGDGSHVAADCPGVGPSSGPGDRHRHDPYAGAPAAHLVDDIAQQVAGGHAVDDAAEDSGHHSSPVAPGVLRPQRAEVGEQARPLGRANWETVQIQQEGPIAYVESTTLGLKEIFDEDRTRFVLLAADESQMQTSAVVAELARSASRPDDPDVPDSVIALHHTAQRLLRPVDVIVPFADQLAGAFPTEKLEVRRTFGQMLSFIQAVALLHQYQREQDGAGRIIAVPSDYDVVRDRLTGPLGRGLGYALTPGAVAMLQCAKGIAGEFTVSDAARKAVCSDSTARGRLRELEGAGQVEKTQEGRGRAPAKYVLAQSPPPLHGLVLPELGQGPAPGASVVPESAANKP
jgi:hypothetical protein